MSIYADLTEAELEAEIASLRTRIRNPDAPIRSIAGEGKRLEFAVSGQASNLRGLLREAEAALALLRGEAGGNAIGVSF